MPSKKRKYNARFPAGRIKKIMQTDEEVGKVAQAVPIIISRTLELFVESLLKKSMSVTLSRGAKTLSPSHVKQCIQSESRFDFLRDLVKNIPDVSAAEEREQNLQSANTSPTANRYTEAATPLTPIKIEHQPSLPSTSKSQLKSIRHQAKLVHSESNNIGCTAEHNGSRNIKLENTASEQLTGDDQAEDLSHRKLPNFYQETLPDPDSNHEYAASQRSVIQYAGIPEATKVISSENKPKIDLLKNCSTIAHDGHPTAPIFRVDLSRVPLQSSLSFDSALHSQPLINFDFTKNLHQPEVKYGTNTELGLQIARTQVSDQSVSLMSSHRSLPAPIQRSTSLVQPRYKEPPALVPITAIKQDIDEDYDT